MTDPDLPHPAADEPLHPLDALASAHLDGEGGPDAVAAEGLETFAERFARFERVRAVVQAPPTAPIDGERREASIAAALAAFDVAALPAGRREADEPAEPADTVVVPIAAARSRRFTSSRWRAIGIAAAVVAGAIAAVPLLTDDGPDADREVAAGLEESADDAADTARAADAPTEADADATTALESEAAGGLGDYADYDALAEGVRAQLAPPAASTELASPPSTSAGGTTTTSAAVPMTGEGNAGGSATGGTDPSATTTPGCPPPNQGQVVYQDDATVEGHPVTVEVVESPDGNRTMEVRDPAGNCDVVDSRDL